MKHIGPAAIAVAALLAPVPAHGEYAGRDIGYAAPGPVFDLPAGVSVERLDIHISVYSVRLVHVFETSMRQMIHFSFAMPDMPVDASPTRHYRLEVEKHRRTDFVAFCPPDAKKISPTRSEWSAKDYSAGDETGVLFFWDTAADEPSDEQE